MIDRFRKIVFLLLIPDFLLIAFATLEMMGFNFSAIPFWIIIGFGLGWFGALFCLSIPIYHDHLQDLKSSERKSHKILKEMHAMIGEHNQRRFGVKL